jgi:hypothetical protein
MNRLSKLVKSQRKACLEILKRASAVAAYLPANPEIFDALFVKAFYARSLGLLSPVAPSGVIGIEWTSLLCSSMVDDGNYARGLLYQALRVAAESGLVIESDAPHFASMLGATVPTKEICVVAYLDYVSATGVPIWSSFHELWRAMLVDATNRGFSGYYWRSSDSFYFVRSLGWKPNEAQKTEACEAMLELLLHVQKHRCFDNKEWMWQMGVAVEKGSLIGDIFLPNKGGPQAVIGMKEGVDKIRGGGVMLVTESFKNALSGQGKTMFDSAPLVGKGKKVVGKKEVEWFYYKRVQ